MVIAKFEEKMSLNPWTDLEINRSQRFWYKLANIETLLPVPFVLLYALVTFEKGSLNVQAATANVQAATATCIGLLLLFSCILFLYVISEIKHRKDERCSKK